ncbi:MAG: (d)CMP kinase [Ktedonobacterales bacterium]
MSGEETATHYAPHAHLQITIDGPAGVGKSTIGERLAQRLGTLYVDTGAFYRTLTYLALAHGLAPDDASALEALARDMHIAIVAPTPTTADGRQYTVLVDGEDITQRLRTPDVEAAVSRVSSHAGVRSELIERMREMAGRQSVVMVGRDIGAVVLPHAHFKVYLTTSLEQRAQRRHRDLVAAQGENAPSLETVRRKIAERDAIDAPHTYIAPDAMVINNDKLEADDVVARILGSLTERHLIQPRAMEE